MRAIVEAQAIEAAGAAVERARQRAALLDRQRVGIVDAAGEIGDAFEREIDAAAADLAGVGAGKRPLRRRGVLEHHIVLARSAVEADLGRRDPGEGIGVDGQGVVAGPGVVDRDRRNFSEIAEGQHRIAVVLVDDLDALHRDRLRIDGLRLMHQFNQK